MKRANKKKADSGKPKKKDIAAAVQRVIDRYGAMGFHYNPERAKGAQEALRAIQKPPKKAQAYFEPHTVVSVAGLMPVSEEW